MGKADGVCFCLEPTDVDTEINATTATTRDSIIDCIHVHFMATPYSIFLIYRYLIVIVCPLRQHLSCIVCKRSDWIPSVTAEV